MIAMNNTVVLTGVGIITPLVNDIYNLASCCSDSKNSIHKKVDIIPAPQDMNNQELRRMARQTKLALYAADKAVGQAGLKGQDGGLYLGLTHGSTSLLKEFHDYLFDYGPGMVSPNAFSNGVTNAPLGAISNHLHLTHGGGTLVGYENCGMEILHYAVSALIRNDLPFYCAGATEEYSPLVEDAYHLLNWYKEAIPTKLPSPVNGNLNESGFSLSEGSVFFTLCPLECSPKNTNINNCFFTPVDDIKSFNKEIDIIISGAGGGPQDVYELEALSLIASNQKTPTGILFSKCFFGETFAVGPLLSSTIAWDILVNNKKYPAFPIHDNLKQDNIVTGDFPGIQSILVLSASRDSDISAGLFTKHI